MVAYLQCVERRFYTDPLHRAGITTRSEITAQPPLSDPHVVHSLCITVTLCQSSALSRLSEEGGTGYRSLGALSFAGGFFSDACLVIRVRTSFLAVVLQRIPDLVLQTLGTTVHGNVVCWGGGLCVSAETRG